jgi:hypothetical protein
MKGHATAKAEMQQLVDAQRAQPQSDSVRRAAEVVRVAAEESHHAADEAMAAALALRASAEEGRAVADLQRSLLAETRRTVAGASDGPHTPGTRLGLQGVAQVR